MALNLAWYDWIGVAGTATVLVGFLLLQAGRISGTAITYQLINLFGSGGVLVSLLGKFNMSVFVLELTWMLISIFGIVRTLKAQRTPRN
jgi:paired small multidrug resistance pump